MTVKLRVAIAQINATVGDLAGNQQLIAGRIREAERGGAQLVVFPELAVTGYPPEDLLFKPSFVRSNIAAFEALSRLTRKTAAVIGFADRDGAGNLYNAAGFAARGRVAARYRKMVLPNYGVFDEKRYFAAGARPMVVGPAGLSVCEDIWVEHGPCSAEADAGAALLVNLSASPYHAGKRFERERLLARRARACGRWICYVNLVGGQDELVFDGGSMLVNPEGRVVFRAPQFQEGLFFVEVPFGSAAGRKAGDGPVDRVRWSPAAGRRPRMRRSRSETPLAADSEIFEALVLGTRDYVRKNGFEHVVLGMSGGIDSALTAAIAVAALGKQRVTAVSMPSRYSSAETRLDARAVARALGIRFMELPLEQMFQASLDTLRDAFGGRPQDEAEQNIQARLRGLLLMALSNKFGWLVLSTGNKSEISTGYCTLYGDMAGGFAVIKDVPKSWVYRLAKTANRRFGRKVVPDSVYLRPPTAELKPGQRDQDTLPPYGQLDRIVKAYVEEDRPKERIRKLVRMPEKEVARVLRMIDASEYKRRQAAIGIKITPRAFGRDRRMPVTNRYKEA